MESTERERHLQRRIAVQWVALCALTIALAAAVALRVEPEEAAALCREGGAPLASASRFSFTCGRPGLAGMWEARE